MSYIVCFNCGKPGHLSTECYSRRSGFSGIICFSCGKPGHLSTDCYSRGFRSSNSVVCFKCGTPGHYASSCGMTYESSSEYESDNGSDVSDPCDNRGAPVSIAYPSISGVYVLQYSNGMMYVGKSNNIERRVHEHESGEFAVSWGEPTMIPTETTPIPNDLESWERNETLHLMKKHGISKVRGWKYTTMTLTPEERRNATEQIREKYDLCRLCGSDKHFASNCKFKK